MSDPTRYSRDSHPTYEQWIDAHGLDFSDLETPHLGNEQTPARRRARRREELRTTA